MDYVKCFEGYAEASGNAGGQCCCNCKWQRPISGHPWNKTEAFHGSIMNVIAWGCTVPDMPNITLSEKEHSMCEMHQARVAA